MILMSPVPKNRIFRIFKLKIILRFLHFQAMIEYSHKRKKKELFVNFLRPPPKLVDEAVVASCLCAALLLEHKDSEKF